MNSIKSLEVNEGNDDRGTDEYSERKREEKFAGEGSVFSAGKCGEVSEIDLAGFVLRCLTDAGWNGAPVAIL